MSATAATPLPLVAARPAVFALLAGLVALGGIFLPECRAAVRVWTESTAYGHCYLVAPIAAYLAWDRRVTVAGLLPQPSAAFLPLGIPLALFWFASERIGIMEFRQFAALGFVELLFLVVLGRRLFQAMLAPLLYLVFLVPFGAFLTPLLQSFTAIFIDVGLSVLTIPHYVSDMVIEIPEGTFFVAEACAGLRFLIASFAFGVFYALLNYQSYTRRTLFIAASIAVPIVANGFRALGIVVLGHVLGSAEAAAADHIIYGWVFFSIVMLFLVVAGMPLRELAATARPASLGMRPARARAPWPAAVVLLLAAVAPMTARGFAGDRAGMPVVGLPMIVAPEGCTGSEPARSPDSMISMITCGARRWSVTVQALPPRSTASAVTEARTLVLGPLDPEETAVEPLTGLPGGTGLWQGYVSRTPAAIAGISIWIRGEPARGGLSQRFQQAIDSLRGNTRPPVVISIAHRGNASLTEIDARSAMAELARIVSAQTDLATAISHVAMSDATKPPS